MKEFSHDKTAKQFMKLNNIGTVKVCEVVTVVVYVAGVSIYSIYKSILVSGKINKLQTKERETVLETRRKSDYFR